ncbi:MAG: MFS transporter [Janthinobacterium lividum]
MNVHENESPEIVAIEASSAREAAFAASLGGALRKARLRIIPLLAICYLVAFMDRANISFAAQTMNRDLGFTPSQYGLGAGLFFLSYALCEIPANRMLLKLGARRWLSGLMLAWGLIAACMVFVHSAKSFYGLRLALGVAEAGYFPGAIFYLSQWFPSSERARSISLFYIAFPLSSTVMGAVAGMLLQLNGVLGLRGWQWLFLVEALPAILLSALMWWGLPASFNEAPWLLAEERQALQQALSGGDGSAGKRAEVAEKGMRQALRSGRAWVLSFMLFLTLGSYYAVVFSLPIVLRGLTGWSQGRVGFLVALLGVFGALAMIFVARSSDKHRERRWHIALPTIVMALSFVAAGARFSGWFAVAALLLGITSFYAMQGPLMGLPNLLLRGEAAAVAIAMLTMGGVAGGFVGPYWMGWMRDRTGSYAGGIGWLAVPCTIAVFCTLWLMHRIVPEEKS